MIALVPAVPGDAGNVAAIFAASRAAHLEFLPILHTPEEDVAHFGEQIARGGVTLAREAAGDVGFVAVAGGRINHLYVAPHRIGQGIGGLLLNRAKAGADTLELWCFQQNTRARRFYEARGFVELRRTQGDNEEGLPDVLYRWQRS